MICSGASHAAELVAFAMKRCSQTLLQKPLYFSSSLAPLQDFKQRVKAYEAVYETIEDNEDGGDIQYIKLYNVGQKVVTKNCKGYLPSQVAFYLQARTTHGQPHVALDEIAIVHVSLASLGDT